MRADSKLMFKVSDMTLHALNGTLDAQGIRELEELLKKSPLAVEYYMEILWTHVGLNSFEGISSLLEPDNSVLGKEFWMSMLEEERTAPTIEIETPEPEKVPVKMLKVEKTPRVVNKFSLYSAILSVAALILVLVYVKVAPPAPSMVATIVDSVDAQWEQGKHPTAVGSRLWGNDGPRWLKKGTVKIAFDYGAEVIIEGPAEFEMQSADKMILNSGRLFATVQEGAAGFTVETPYSTVIDLGTEFGLEVGFDGSTEVHMIKGKASLIPGRIGDKKEGFGIIAGQAREVSKTGKVETITLKEQAFVREFDSEKQVLWRGESVNLADIVGGGNGFGTGGQNYGVELTEDKVYDKSLYVHGHADRESTGFNPISSIDGIDGTFIPDSSRGPVIISSHGNIFHECPDTTGFSAVPVINGARAKSDERLLEKKGRTYPDGQLMLADVECGTDDNPSIFMHANAGITFDLKKIYDVLPEAVQASRFSTLVGVPDNCVQESSLDIWVLVDGQVQFSQLMVGIDQTFNVDIPLTGTERFLTLIVTDGVKDTGKIHAKDGYDWCLFCRPYLELVSGE